MNAQRYAVTGKINGEIINSVIKVLTDDEIKDDQEMASDNGWLVENTDIGFTMFRSDYDPEDRVTTTVERIYIALGNDVVDLEG